jgi:hypothetical protein
VITLVPGGAQPAADCGAVALGQMTKDTSLLVTDAALNRRALAKHITHGLS